jgi:subtilase family serine protease
MALIFRLIGISVAPANDRGPVPPGQKFGYITLLLKPSDTQQSALEELLRQQQDQSSRQYHHWLTPEEFGDQCFHADDIPAIVSWLESRSLHIENVARAS